MEKYTENKKSIFSKNTQKEDLNTFITNYLKEKTEKTEIKTETDLNTNLEINKTDITPIINQILNYWLQIKQYDKRTTDNIKLKEFLTLHKQEWAHFLKKCFLKMEFYKDKQEFKNQNKKNINEDEAKIYANYENWVRNYLKINTKTNTSIFSKIGFFKDDGVMSAKNLATAKNKTNMLMNTLNSMNAMFIIVNSQFEMTLKYYERALRNDKYKDNNNDVIGFDRVWDLCESTVAYQKLLLPPDFNEDKQAILNQVEMSDFISDTTTPPTSNTSDTKTTSLDEIEVVV